MDKSVIDLFDESIEEVVNMTSEITYHVENNKCYIRDSMFTFDDGNPNVFGLH
jgi:hypothetical protein